MKHCIFCGTEYDDDARLCYRCKDYKGMVDGPIWEDNRDRAEDEMRITSMMDDAEPD